MNLYNILVTAPVQNGLSYLWFYSFELGAGIGLGLGLGLINLPYAVKTSSYDWAPPLACHKSHSPLASILMTWALAVLGVRCLHMSPPHWTLIMSHLSHYLSPISPESLRQFRRVSSATLYFLLLSYIHVFLEWIPISLSLPLATPGSTCLPSVMFWLTSMLHDLVNTMLSRSQLRVTLRFSLCCSHCPGISLYPAAN